MKKQEMKRGKTMLITILAVIVSLSIIAWALSLILGVVKRYLSFLLIN